MSGVEGEAGGAEGFDEGAEPGEYPTSDSGSVDAGVLIPRGGAFEGQVAITGPTRIDGSVRGSLRGAGDLVIGVGGRVEGRVECEALVSAGEIVGPVEARLRARFEAGARLDGDLRTPLVSFDEAAVWNGRARIGGDAGDNPGASG